MTTAMPMMPPMTLMEKICKEGGSVSNLLVIPEIAEVTAVGAVAAAEDLEAVMVETAAAAEDLETEVVVVLEATLLDPGLITDWSWRTCLHVLLGRT